MSAVLPRLEAFKSRVLLSDSNSVAYIRTLHVSRFKSQQARLKIKTAPYERESASAPPVESFSTNKDHSKANDHLTSKSDTTNVSISHSSGSVNLRLVYALRLQNPDKLLQAFFECSADKALIRSIPDTTFGEILKLLRPANLIEPYKAVHKDLSATSVKLFRLQPIEETFESYFQTVRAVVDLRRQTGSRLNLADYTLLLDCARALGDGLAADNIWSELKRDGVNPDTTCYNHYMSAKCWSGLFQPSLRLRTRVHNFLTRITGTLSWRYRREHRSGKQVILRAYEDMVSRGLFGDRTTFTLLITAMARGGDVTGMKSVLKNVWNIDTDKIMEPEGELEPVKHFPKDSPLLPTSELLFALAHGFGINSDIPTALRLVDYVSRSYDIPIPIAVWEELFAWTFSLSVPRYGSRVSDKADMQRLPITSMQSLWQVMTGEPYNIKPTMSMYDRYIRNLFQRSKVGEALRRMEEGRILFKNSVRVFRRAWRELELAKSVADRGIEIPITEVTMGHLQRKVENARLVKIRDLIFIRRWVRKMLRSPKFLSANDWERRGLPMEMRKWEPFLPRRIKYRSSGGVIQLRRLEPSIVTQRAERTLDGS